LTRSAPRSAGPTFRRKTIDQLIQDIVCSGRWTARPNTPLRTLWCGWCFLAISSLFHRTEPRIPKSILVRLFDPEKRDFEISLTVDVSSHGALVVCKNPWQPNTYISVHSMGGSMYSPARVVHCQPLKDRSYAVGLELAGPLPDWLEIQRAATPDRQALDARTR